VTYQRLCAMAVAATTTSTTANSSVQRGTWSATSPIAARRHRHSVQHPEWPICHGECRRCPACPVSLTRTR
jgi:hypothetical protein